MARLDLNPAHPVPKAMPLPPNHSTIWGFSLSWVLPWFWRPALPLRGFISGCSRQSFYLEFPPDSSPSFWDGIMVPSWVVCDFTPQMASEKPGGIFDCHNWAGELLLASSREGYCSTSSRPRTSPDSKKNYPALEVSSAEDEYTSHSFVVVVV